MAFEVGPTSEDHAVRGVTPGQRQRLVLGRTRRRLSFERRLRIWIACFCCPIAILTWFLCRLAGFTVTAEVLCTGAVLMVCAIASSYFFEGVIRPLQTLSNIVASLREDDYSFRARGALRGDAMGDLALEVNALAGTLQRQRNSAMDALTLADRVMRSMQSPLFAFDEGSRLRMMNAAAEHLLQLNRAAALGRRADELGLAALIGMEDASIYAPAERDATGLDGIAARWSIRRSTFRLYGVPHDLFVLSDVAAVLQEEERLAWQRLIRVLGHEINNSLTPIKSIAATLRSRPFEIAGGNTFSADDMRRGLAVIEDRADSLHRFLQAYQELSRLPAPRMQNVEVRALVHRMLPMEPRLHVSVQASPDLVVRADPDQLQQVLINLVKNAADAALDPEARPHAPMVSLGWRQERDALLLYILDNGLGLANADNAFVPFYTTKPTGTGIGLTLSRQIIAAHRGSVQLRNRGDERGCIAEVQLPLAGTPPNVFARQPAAGDPVHPSSS